MSHDAPHPTGTPASTRGRLGAREVARVGFGAMQLERLHGDRQAAVAVMERAIELGVDHIDTAEFYGDGFANGIIRDTVGPDAGIVVATKVGADPDPGGPFPMRVAQRPEELRASVEENLRSLGTERVPLVNLRRMDGSVRIPMSAEQTVDLDDQLAAMMAMRDEGKIGAIGLSTVSLENLRRALPAGIACVQNAYSLLNREDEPLLELCLEHDIAWVPYFPLGSAFPGMPKVTDEPAVRSAAVTLDATPAQVGLAWLLHHAPNILLIPGTSSIDHLEANLAAAALTLDPATILELDSIPPRAGSLPR